MKTLILHHLEPCWENGYHKMGTSFEEQMMNARKHLKKNRYGRVILTRFEDHILSSLHDPIARYIDEIHTYMYGWERSEIVEGDEWRWCEGGSHSEVVLLEDWMQELPKSSTYIGGGFDGECLEDLEIALAHLGVDYKRVTELIV